MKEEDVLKFLAPKTYLGSTNFDFQMKQYTYKKKSDGIYIRNLERTVRSFRELAPLLLLKNQLVSASYPPGIPARGLC